MSSAIETRVLSLDDLGLIGTIDRSEHVDVEYEVVGGAISERAVTYPEVPQWFPTGNGDHTVAKITEFAAECIEAGAIFLGAFDGEAMAGLVIVNPSLERDMAWLALLHVSRPYRGRGIASMLWDEAVELAQSARSRTMYVSATPTGSAVGFYTSRGCVLADPVHPQLFDDEPDDIHMVCPIA